MSGHKYVMYYIELWQRLYGDSPMLHDFSGVNKYTSLFQFTRNLPYTVPENVFRSVLSPLSWAKHFKACPNVEVQRWILEHCWAVPRNNFCERFYLIILQPMWESFLSVVQDPFNTACIWLFWIGVAHVVYAAVWWQYWYGCYDMFPKGDYFLRTTRLVEGPSYPDPLWAIERIKPGPDGKFKVPIYKDHHWYEYGYRGRTRRRLGNREAFERGFISEIPDPSVLPDELPDTSIRYYYDWEHPDFVKTPGNWFLFLPHCLPTIEINTNWNYKLYIGKKIWGPEYGYDKDDPQTWPRSVDDYDRFLIHYREPDIPCIILGTGLDLILGNVFYFAWISVGLLVRHCLPVFFRYWFLPCMAHVGAGPHRIAYRYSLFYARAFLHNRYLCAPRIRQKLWERIVRAIQFYKRNIFGRCKW